MAEEGQKAWQAWVDVGRLHVSTPWPLVDAEIKAAWAAVERTTANDALRRAAEVAEDYADHYLGGSEGLAAAIRARIGEGGE